jgi:hypothetical protein
MVAVLTKTSREHTCPSTAAWSADWSPPVISRNKTVPDWRGRKPPDYRIGGVCSAPIISLSGCRNARCRAVVRAARTAAGLRAEARASALPSQRCRLSRAARAARAADSYVSTLISSSLKKAGLSANLCASGLNLRSSVP